MTYFTLCPQVIGQRQPQLTVAVSILEQSATLDAIRVFLAVQTVVAAEVHRPLQCHVPALAGFILDATADGDTDAHLGFVGLGDDGSYTY